MSGVIDQRSNNTVPKNGGKNREGKIRIRINTVRRHEDEIEKEERGKYVTPYQYGKNIKTLHLSKIRIGKAVAIQPEYTYWRRCNS